MPHDVTVRPATGEDLTGILGVLDAGALATDADRVRASIDRGDAFVAVRSDADGEPATILGALVLVDAAGAERSDGTAEIDAVAVRRGRRGQGIGRALVRAAGERYDRLVAEFDAGVRPFYENLGFTVRAVDGEERFRGSIDCEER
ncbi:GNAT family N-acetyltransferase [Halosimplex salinum]|uniref:GNAT family N-acetyltransferase n=1 Tax=Halosimplex salinum TaxID=1710538 RepID=UPI001F24E97C|nr:GNAT family N-acetyltransferase [Halosimplex salinum]